MNTEIASEQIRRNLALHHLLTNGHQWNGCRKNESLKHCYGRSHIQPEATAWSYKNVSIMGLFHTNMQLSALQDINKWTGGVWIIVIFFSAVWTLILTTPIHCRGSNGEQGPDSQNILKKTFLLNCHFLLIFLLKKKVKHILYSQTFFLRIFLSFFIRLFLRQNFKKLFLIKNSDVLKSIFENLCFFFFKNCT